MNMRKHEYAFAALAVVAMPVIGVAAWVPTADSTTSAPKFTDGNFVISWNTGNKQLKYESHDASVSTVCDMSTLSEDVDAVAGYSHPTQVAGSGFAGKSGITRVILPEACYGINQQSFSSMVDLWYMPTSKPRQTVFVPEQYAAEWRTTLSNHGTWTAIADADRARADYPTKLEDVKVKVAGSKFDLVPSRVKESDVLGLSTEGSVNSPYYVVQWREAVLGMSILLR